MSLPERAAWSFLLLPLAEGSGASRARIVDGTGLGEQAARSAVAGLTARGLVTVAGQQVRAVPPEGDAAGWFQPRRGTEHLPWYRRYSYWVLYLRGPECPLTYDHTACLWLLLDLDQRGRTRGQSYAGLGQLLGVSYKTVQRAVAAFQRGGYLTVRHRGRGGARRFDFAFRDPPPGFGDWWDRGAGDRPDDEPCPDDQAPVSDPPAAPAEMAEDQECLPGPVPMSDLETCLRVLANHDIPTSGKKLGDLPAMVEQYLGRADEYAGIVGFTSLVAEAQQQHNVSGTAPHCGFLLHDLLGRRLDQQVRAARRHDDAMGEWDRKIAEFNRLVAPAVERFGPRAPSKCPACEQHYRQLLRVPPHQSPEAEAASIRILALLADRNPTVTPSIKGVRCDCGEQVVGRVAVQLHQKGYGEWWFPAVPEEEPKPGVAAEPLVEAAAPVSLPAAVVRSGPLERHGLSPSPRCPACDRQRTPSLSKLPPARWPTEVTQVRDRLEGSEVVQQVVVGSVARCPACRGDWPGLVLQADLLDGERWVTGYRDFPDAVPLPKISGPAPEPITHGHGSADVHEDDLVDILDIFGPPA